MSVPAEVPAPRDDEDEEGGGFDARLLVDYASYAGRALRLHWPRAALLFVLVAGPVVTLSALLPKKYMVETTLLAQNNQIIAALGNPSRSFPRDDLAPTRAVAETVQNRDNLISLVRQTDLVEYWRQHRPPLSRLKAAVMGLLRRRSLDDDALVDALVFLLQQRLLAWTHDNKITITITWDDPVMALRLLEAAQQNFLETRHVTDTAIIAESISILEGHLATARQEVDEALATARVRRSAARAAGDDQADLKITYPGASASPSPADSELGRLRVLIGTKRRGVSDLEAFRRQRLGELQSQLAEQRAVYAESHPVIVNLLQSIQALGQDSPQLAALRRELQDLEAQYVAKGGLPGDLDAEESAAPPRFIPTIVASSGDRSSRRDPAEDYAQSRLSAAITRYNVLVDRLAAARMELDAARAAFKYRYTVIQPPLPPKRPAGGKAVLLGGAGVVAGFVLALLGAVLAEIRRGLIVQAWQVERQLELPILSELPPQA